MVSEPQVLRLNPTNALFNLLQIVAASVYPCLGSSRLSSLDERGSAKYIYSLAFSSVQTFKIVGHCINSIQMICDPLNQTPNIGIFSKGTNSLKFLWIKRALRSFCAMKRAFIWSQIFRWTCWLRAVWCRRNPLHSPEKDCTLYGRVVVDYFRNHPELR
jgi:hypothetical protein